MRSDYKKAVNRHYVPDTSNQENPSEDAQLQLAPLDIADLVMDAAVRRGVITLRAIAAHAEGKYYPQTRTITGLWAWPTL